MSDFKDSRVLNSWKEIASFFDVSVRTAQRWEKSAGLPVYRQDMGRPIAYVEELKQWQDERAGKQNSAESRRSIRLVLAGSMVIFLLFAGFMLRVLDRTAVPAEVSFEASRFVAWDGEGSRLWEYELPEVVLLERYQFEAPLDTHLIADIDDDGATEVLFNFRTPVGSLAPSKLYCFSEKGELRWELGLGREREFDGRQFSGAYAGHFVRLVRDKAGRPYILTVAQHIYWYPSQVALLDPANGQLVEEYWHPGGISHILLRDLDKDGTEEVVLGGINNPGDGMGRPSLMSLKIPFSLSTRKTDSPYAEFTGGTEQHYILFPRPDTSFVGGTLLLFSELLPIDSEVFLAKLRITAGMGSLLYFFDNGFQLEEFGVSDNLTSVHDEFWLRRLLDHRFDQAEKDCLARLVRFPTAPDGNDPDLDQLWSACEYRPAEDFLKD